MHERSTAKRYYNDRTRRGGSRHHKSDNHRSARYIESSRNSKASSSRDHPTFLTFNTDTITEFRGALVDSGACTSVVGNLTLDRAMRELNISKLDDARITTPVHHFGHHNEESRTLFAVRFRFTCRGKILNRGRRQETAQDVKFYIRFDVIDGDLPFLIVLPSLRSMRASLNF